MMFLQAIFAASLAISVSAQSNVTLSYGQYQGTNLPGGITQFLGVRYANTPQRFSASGPPTTFVGLGQATSYAPGCQGSGAFIAGTSEDCLYANIFTPTSAVPSNSTIAKKKLLPVYVFIQGGGLTNTLGRFNGTGLINAANKSIITVTFTYRTGAFGFLASKEVQAGGSLNVGLRDQLQLLRWVKKEIANFGGDASQVTVGGQSAGAGSVMLHLTGNGGVDSNLFQAAILQSPSSPPIRTISEQQFQYDNLVKATNCTGQQSLLCLRGLTMAQILTASPIIPYPGSVGPPVFGWHAVIDGTYIQDYPFTAMTNGKIINVPILVGSVTDEGSVFTPRNISNSTQADTFMQNNFPNITGTQLESYNELYDFNTTSSNYWLKASASYGETRYICPSIYISNRIKTWNFRYNIATANQISSLDGVSHGSDLAALWAPGYGPSDQIALLQGPAKQATQWFQGYWASFIQTHDPNTNSFPGSPNWRVWSGGYRFLFNATGSGIESIPQAQRTRCNYLGSIGSGLEQ